MWKNSAKNIFRIKDIAKYKYEFERDVIVDIARNAKTGVKYSAEKYIRFTEEKLKSKEAFIEKLRLKNAKMSDRNRKILHQLKVQKYKNILFEKETSLFSHSISA